VVPGVKLERSVTTSSLASMERRGKRARPQTRAASLSPGHGRVPRSVHPAPAR
jgi:hypothetical protein